MLSICTRSGHEKAVVFVRYRLVKATLKIRKYGFLEISSAVISIFGSLKILLNFNIQTSEVMISKHYIYIHRKPTAIISLIFHTSIFLPNSFRFFFLKSLEKFRRNIAFSESMKTLTKISSKFSSIVVIIIRKSFLSRLRMIFVIGSGLKGLFDIFYRDCSFLWGCYGCYGEHVLNLLK
jgi:hypothetical protein